jgi:hypothetical protein
MHRLLLAAAASAAITVSASPAGALDRHSRSFPVARSGPVAGSPVFTGCAIGARRDRGGARGCGTAVFDVYGGEWAQYNNRTFDSDSYNDWWHDRPDRAFPRWMQSNQDCARLWWSGGGWRC